MIKTNLNTVYIGLGSNLGDKNKNIKKAIKLIKEKKIANKIKCSSFHKTKPAGVKNQPEFINAVIGGTTTLSPLTLLKELKIIERDMGRIYLIRWGPRIIDLDILLYGNKSVNLPNLKIPHPLMHKRKFVTEPLLEIAPELTKTENRRWIIENNKSLVF
jgi:2-amino-4-hydroxy-6-hydroxymethyldihydropteridine diphosphokinase